MFGHLYHKMSKHQKLKNFLFKSMLFYLTSSIPPGVEVENKSLMNSKMCLMSNAIEVMLHFQQGLYQWGFNCGIEVLTTFKCLSG